MNSFKSFLSEHIVIGKASSGIDTVGVKHDDPSVIVIIPGRHRQFMSVRFDVELHSISHYVRAIDQFFDSLDQNKEYRFGDRHLFTPLLKTFEYHLSMLSAYSQKTPELNAFRKWILSSPLKDDLANVMGKKYEDLTVFQRMFQSLLFVSGLYVYSVDTWRKSFHAKLQSGERAVSFPVIANQVIYLDHSARKVILHNDDVDTQHRMPSWAGPGKISDRTHVFPSGHDSTTNNYNLKKMLISVIKAIPEVSNYQIADQEILSDQLVSVKDFISPQQRVGASAQSIANKFIKPITVYHGTSLSTYTDVIKHKGLHPGKGYYYGDKVRGHSENLVYFTYSVSEARKYAVRAGASRGSVVLQVTIDDFSKISFDEDTFFSGYSRLDPKVKLEIQRRVIEIIPRYANRVNEKGLFDPYVAHDLLRSDLQEEPRLRPIINLIAGMIVHSTSTTSFSYSGVIAPSKIKVVEQFKAAALGKDPSSELYKDKYAATLKTFKSWF